MFTKAAKSDLSPRHAPLGAALAMLCGLALSSEVHASNNHAYVWASNPTKAQYNATGTYAHNPTKQPIVIKRSGTGKYTVSFKGLKVAGGDVQVSSYGPGNDHCKVARWNKAGDGLNVDVLCFKNTTPADAKFTAMVHLPRASPWSQVGYVWASNPKAPSYSANKTYAYQTNGKLASIKRTGPGKYTVTFTGLKPSKGLGGNVQATAYGSGAAYCKVAQWNQTAAGLNASVTCFEGSSPTDSRFTALVNLPRNIGRTKMAFAWANNPTAASYAANKTYSYQPNKKVPAIKRNGKGKYTVNFSGFWGKKGVGGHAQVSAYGSGNERCKVQSWSGARNNMNVNVLCFSSSGAPADTRFSLLAVSN